MASPASVTPASTSIPFLYRLIITSIEPFFASTGAVMAFAVPGKYLDTMTRSSAPYDAKTHFLYTELGGAWLYFAFVEAVVLRFYDDLRLWKLLCAGMLLSDVAYCHSAAQAVGGWPAWFTVSDWSAEDWFVLATTAPMVLARILIVLGVGVQAMPKAGKTA